MDAVGAALDAIEGDMETGMSMVRMLREDYSIFVSGVTYPVIPKGIILFRLIPTTAHTDEDVDRTIEAFGNMGNRLGLFQS